MGLLRCRTERLDTPGRHGGPTIRMVRVTQRSAVVVLHVSLPMSRAPLESTTERSEYILFKGERFYRLDGRSPIYQSVDGRTVDIRTVGPHER